MNEPSVNGQDVATERGQNRMSLRRILRHIRCSAPCVFSALIVVSWTSMLTRTRENSGASIASV